MILVAVQGWDPEPWAEHVRAALPGREVAATDADGIWHGPDASLGSVRYALLWKPRPDLVRRLSGLRVLFSLGAGVDSILSLPDLPDVPIVRIVDPDLTMRMSEYVVWRVLDHHRQGDVYRRQQAEALWREPPQPAASDVTIGILGLGELGRDAAGKLKDLGFRVLGWSRAPKKVEGVESFSGPDGLDDLLARTDILVSLLPLTPQTRGMLDSGLIAKLKRNGPLGGPILVNAGRGGSQVDADILAALKDGRLRAASLDVFETEPLPPENPLWRAPNLFVTPHSAANSDPRSLAANIAAQIEAFERGEELRNIVDRAAGY